jgi:hypothetical protein
MKCTSPRLKLDQTRQLGHKSRRNNLLHSLDSSILSADHKLPLSQVAFDVNTNQPIFVESFISIDKKYQKDKQSYYSKFNHAQDSGSFICRRASKFIISNLLTKPFNMQSMQDYNSQKHVDKDALKQRHSNLLKSTIHMLNKSVDFATLQVQREQQEALDVFDGRRQSHESNNVMI